MTEVQRVLLPKNVKPIHYTVHIKPDLETFKFSGCQHVTLQVISNTSEISFNALEIIVTKATLSSSSSGGPPQTATAIDHNAEAETVTVRFATPVPAGTEAVLYLEYSGDINDKLVGFYRSKYEHGGKTYYLGTTQFEPCDARRAFPCWDEPAVKAKFSFILSGPKDLTFLANMPPKTETIEGNVKTVHFEETPIMSTYLIAYCIGHFECLETKTPEGIVFRVWTVPGKKELGSFALDVGAKVLSYFTNYYGIPYPLPKQDMIAVPDFSFGAMENWGLITYRETALLCNEKSSFQAKARVAYVVAHELAHQWFGNLVTMEWWKQLWLNEGFATFMGTKAVDHIFPQWQSWTKFLVDNIFRALKADSLRSSHPIEVDVSVARKIDEIFDAISYAKGASVIKMIEAALGSEGFRKGLNIYLNRFKYSNAVTEDLWQGLTEGSGVDVAAIMDTWVKYMGFPVIDVEETGEKGKFKVTQNRYLAAGDVKPEDNQVIWPVMLGVSSKSHPNTVFIPFKTRTAVVTVQVDDDQEWVKFNSGQTGLFRVKYSENLLKRLGPNLIHLSPEDRAGVQSDTFALAISGDIPLTSYLQLLSYYKGDKNDTVWTDILGNLSSIRKLFSGNSSVTAQLEKFVLDVTEEIGQELGWVSPPGEDESRQSLRGLVLNSRGSCGDAAVIEEAKKRWTQFLSDRTSIPADLQSAIFYLAVSSGGEKELNSMIEVFKTSTLPAEKVIALRCIGASQNVDLLQRALEYMMSDEVRMQDRFILLYAVSSSSKGRSLCWNFVKSNWSKFPEKFSHNLIPRVISYTCENFTQVEEAKEVEAFFTANKVEGTERTLAQTIESIYSNASILARNENSVVEWLSQRYKN